MAEHTYYIWLREISCLDPSFCKIIEFPSKDFDPVEADTNFRDFPDTAPRLGTTTQTLTSWLHLLHVAPGDLLVVGTDFPLVNP